MSENHFKRWEITLSNTYDMKGNLAKQLTALPIKFLELIIDNTGA